MPNINQNTLDLLFAALNNAERKIEDHAFQLRILASSNHKLFGELQELKAKFTPKTKFKPKSKRSR